MQYLFTANRAPRRNTFYTHAADVDEEHEGAAWDQLEQQQRGFEADSDEVHCIARY